MTEKKDISVMIDDVKFNFRVGAILEYNGKVAIEKGDETFGVIPGGRVKALEDVKTTLIREIQEEMHFDISKKEMKLQSVIENFFVYKEVKHHELYFVYRIMLDENDEIVNKTKEEFINYDSECNWYDWVEIDKIDDEAILPVELKNIIKDREFKTYIVRDLKDM